MTSLPCPAISAVQMPISIESLVMSLIKTLILNFEAAISAAFSSIVLSHQQAYLSYDFCSHFPSASIFALIFCIIVTSSIIGELDEPIAATCEHGDPKQMRAKRQWEGCIATSRGAERSPDVFLE